MKRAGFIAVSSSVAIASVALPAGAQPAPQISSDQNLRVARATIAGLIAQVQTEQADYSGHRLAAIDKLNVAEREINAALAFRHADTPNQALSDAVLRHVEDRTDALVQTLQNDQADYGGHRVAAIAALKDAIGQLNAALAR